MFYKIYRYWINEMPRVKGILFKVLFSHKNLHIGKNFKCDAFCKMNITQNGKVIIGDNVHLRRDVEIRCHQNSQIHIEGNNRIDIGVRLLATNNAIIHIGQKVRVGLHSVFNGGDDIRVGESSLISGFVYLQTSNHKFDKKENIQDQGYTHMPINIGDNAWIAAHAVVLPGITIGAGSVVGSNAVVTKDTAQDSINGGVPSKFLKSRYA